MEITPKTVIKAVGFNLYHPSCTLMEDTSFEFYTGNWYQLIGASNCGKTSLMEALAGLSSDWSGQLEIVGMHMDGPMVPAMRKIRTQVGYAPQQICLLLDKTVRLNLGMAIEASGCDDPTEQELRITKILEHFGWVSKRLTEVRKLSYSERITLQLMQAMVRKPKILIIDHALAYLHEDDRENWINYLFDWIVNSDKCLITTAYAPLRQHGKGFQLLHMHDQCLESIQDPELSKVSG